MTLWRK